jgi:creatinine amidohydrolase/Fe(II)-dependent formamide hydrolase-like protein
MNRLGILTSMAVAQGLAPRRGTGRLLASRMILMSLVFAFVPAASARAASAQIDELTWTELRDAIKAGKTTVIIPVGGTEQSGPHLALGKHNVRAKQLAERVATELADALVAPVVAYVPEGSISPPTQHMRYAGTISIPDAAFSGVIDGAARSLRQHGFTDVVLIGDHGGYQSLLRASADRLNKEWGRGGARVHFIAEYYDAAQLPYGHALKSRGFSEAQIGSHAGLADTSLMLATDPSLVRTEAMKVERSAAQALQLGVHGDPRQSSVALGEIGVEIIVSRTVAAIRHAIDKPR